MDINEHHEQGKRQTPETSSMHGCIQIWKKGNPTTLYATISHDFGCVYDLKWCPFGYGQGRLGLIAGTFGDGSVRILNIPLVNQEETLHRIRY